MARAVEAAWPGPLSGLVITRYGHAVPCRRIEVIEAGHPTPDAAGLAATARVLAELRGLTADDLVLCLVSGGGSALLVQPAAGITLADKQALTRSLLASGAPIREINCVRKHLSAVKGGRLALAAHPAQVLTLIISDVPGDDPAVIASGPTVPDPSTRAEARAILEKRGIDAGAAVRTWLASPKSETPKASDTRLARVSTVMIATPALALAAAAERARAAGWRPVLLGDAVEGEARVVAAAQAALAIGQQRAMTPSSPPCVLLSGGETTVTVRGTGRGGRNSEFALALALALRGAPGIWALACDTDGIDGTEDNAGARIAPDTIARAAQAGLDPQALLDNNDSYALFAALGDLVITGPTRTNVNDFRAILVCRPQQ